MTAETPPPVCRNCGREPADGTLGHDGWCAECRTEVIRRATPRAWAAAVAAGVAYLAVAWKAGAFVSDFVVFWLALGALLVFGTFRFSRRVAFDVIRSQHPPPPRT